MKQQTVVLNNRTYFLSEKAFKKIQAIIEDDLQMQEINQSIWNSMNNPEPETYNNKLPQNWKLPQEKSLLFSKNS